MVVGKLGDRWILVRQFDHSQHAGALPRSRLEVPVPCRAMAGRFAGQVEMEAALAAAPEDTATTVYMAASA